ncbi:outer membrane protein [Hyphococcus sp.]|uniref:outer membrane protein n=1 Tax=Hyphococcus sp. TaxID=2038636 RepID=UPI00208B264B|nr:MAG: hypothetical protein DHS20C04_01450 [Marinicaulis sp.]
MKQSLTRAIIMTGVAAGVLAAGTAPSLAQDEAVNDGGYVRLSVGATFVSDWTQDLSYNPNVVFVTAPASSQTVDNGTALAFSAALGFDYADGIRTELEYRYASTPVGSVTPVGGPSLGGPVKDSIGAHFVMTNFYFDFANSSALTPFIGGGVGGAFVTNENDQRDSALALQARAGVAIALGEGLSADAEFVYLRSNELDFGPGIDEFVVGGPVGPAITGARYQSSTAMLSVRKKF